MDKAAAAETAAAASSRVACTLVSRSSSDTSKALDPTSHTCTPCHFMPWTVGNTNIRRETVR